MRAPGPLRGAGAKTPAGREPGTLVASWPIGRLFLCNNQTYCLEIGGATLVGDDQKVMSWSGAASRVPGVATSKE